MIWSGGRGLRGAPLSPAVHASGGFPPTGKQQRKPPSCGAPSRPYAAQLPPRRSPSVFACAMAACEGGGCRPLHDMAFGQHTEHVRLVLLRIRCRVFYGDLTSSVSPGQNRRLVASAIPTNVRCKYEWRAPERSASVRPDQTSRRQDRSPVCEAPRPEKNSLLRAVDVYGFLLVRCRAPIHAVALFGERQSQSPTPRRRRKERLLSSAYPWHKA